MMRQIKFDLSQVIQLAAMLTALLGAWYSLSMDMALIQSQMKTVAEQAAKQAAEVASLEQRVNDLEQVQRDLWRDVRSISDGQR